MTLWLKRILLLILIVPLALFAVSVLLNWDTIQRVFLGGKKVYETIPPTLPADIRRPAILVFSKTNAFRHEDAIPAANRLFAAFAKDKGWGYFQTENAATFSPAILARFDAVIFNNVSGDVFTPAQRAAFKSFIEKGGGYVGIHASGDNSHKGWHWYAQEIIGADFTGHPLNPQFQRATVRIEDKKHPAARGLPDPWVRTDEWYSFEKPARKQGIHVLATLDESTYSPQGMFGQDLRMGKDHPIAWWRCVGKGRVLYSALGHTSQSFAEPEYKAMLHGAANWALKLEGVECGTAPSAPSDRRGTP